MANSCQWPIGDDCLCGSPTPRREAYCGFHSGVARIQRKSALEADALAIEHQAACRLADEYDAAQERGEIKINGGARNFTVPNENSELPSAADIGISRKTVFEARQIRDAEKADPGIVQRTLDEQIERGEEPTIKCVGVTLANLNASMCKFPLGDPTSESFRYCGAPSPAGRPYCIHHHGIAHEPRSALRRRNQPHELQATPWVFDPAFVSPGIG